MSRRRLSFAAGIDASPEDSLRARREPRWARSSTCASARSCTESSSPAGHTQNHCWIAPRRRYGRRMDRRYPTERHDHGRSGRARLVFRVGACDRSGDTHSTRQATARRARWRTCAPAQWGAVPTAVRVRLGRRGYVTQNEIDGPFVRIRRCHGARRYWESRRSCRSPGREHPSPGTERATGAQSSRRDRPIRANRGTTVHTR
jgi:hypothetical protein